MMSSQPQRSPFPSLRITARIFAKATALFVVFNLICGITNFDLIGTLTQFNTWGLVGHGRPRLAYASDYNNGQLPLPALVAAHQLAYTPKAPDEYRVIVLGDSAVSGWGLSDQETFSAQLTARQLQIRGKRLIAYNLAYPEPSVVHDALILDAVLPYRPDLILWFTTALALDNSAAGVDKIQVFLRLNRQRLHQITQAQGLTDWYKTRFPSEPPSWLALRNPDIFPIWLASLVYPFSKPATGVSTRIFTAEPIPARAELTLQSPGFSSMPNETWDFLRVGRDLAATANAKMLIINEPLPIMIGLHSDTNYNGMIARDFYDRYRAALVEYTQQHNLAYLDLWNVLPPTNFTDAPLHINADGYAQLVTQISAHLN